MWNFVFQAFVIPKFYDFKNLRFLRKNLTVFNISKFCNLINNFLGVSQNTTDGIQSNTSINSAPSPVHMEAPGSPILQLPPPPPFLPPSFMGLPPPPMMGPGGAPPPFPPMFLPPGEIRPPPLGRLMSPPPHHHSRYIDDGNSILDDDYDDEYDDYNEDRRPRVYSRNGRFTPDSRYDYNSRYDTETDFSPPPSPTSITRSEDGQIRRNGFKDRDHRDRRGASQRNGNNGLNESSGRSKKGTIILENNSSDDVCDEDW